MNTVTIVELIAFAALSAAVLILTVKVLAGPLRPSFAPHSRPSDERPRETVQSVVPASQDAAGPSLELAGGHPGDGLSQEELTGNALRIEIRRVLKNLDGSTKDLLGLTTELQELSNMAIVRQALPRICALRDHIERANQVTRKHGAACDAIRGILHAYHALLSSLEIVEIQPCIGEVFDPSVHRVVEKIGEIENIDQAVVRKAVQPGFLSIADGRVLHPAFVSVSAPTPNEKREDAQEEAKNDI